MKWSRVVKGTAPTSGTYRDWKPQLATEGGHRCVYCCIPEGAFGGLRNFHVEHLRPKSLYRHLENTYGNLFFACAVCNSFKGDDWIEVASLPPTKPCYPDPSVTDYAYVFSVSYSDGRVAGTCVAGDYLVERLFLNRPQLVVERRLSNMGVRLSAELKLVEDALAKALSPGASTGVRKKAVALLRRTTKLSVLVAGYSKVVPYGAADLRRPDSS